MDSRVEQFYFPTHINYLALVVEPMSDARRADGISGSPLHKRDPVFAKNKLKFSRFSTFVTTTCNSTTILPCFAMTQTKPKPQAKDKNVKQPPCPHPENGLRIWGDDFTVAPHSGLSVPNELKELLAKSGHLKCAGNGPGQRARNLYVKREQRIVVANSSSSERLLTEPTDSVAFHPMEDLTPFGFCSFVGLLDEVKKVSTVQTLLQCTVSSERSSFHHSQL